MKVLKVPVYHCAHCFQPLQFDPVSPKEANDQGYVVGRCPNLKVCSESAIRLRVPMEYVECEEDDRQPEKLKAAVGRILVQ